MAKTKSDKKLYGRLRDTGIRKRVAKRVAEALPAKGQKKPARAHRLADELLGRGRDDQGARGRRLAEALQSREEGGAHPQDEGREAQQVREDGREGPPVGVFFAVSSERARRGLSPQMWVTAAGR